MLKVPYYHGHSQETQPYKLVVLFSLLSLTVFDYLVLSKYTYLFMNLSLLSQQDPKQSPYAQSIDCGSTIADSQTKEKYRAEGKRKKKGKKKLARNPFLFLSLFSPIKQGCVMNQRLIASALVLMLCLMALTETRNQRTAKEPIRLDTAYHLALDAEAVNKSDVAQTEAALGLLRRISIHGDNNSDDDDDDDDGDDDDDDDGDITEKSLGRHKRSKRRRMKLRAKNATMSGHEIFVWSKAKFRKIWLEKKIWSCVEHCSSYHLSYFQLPSEVECSASMTCSYEKFPVHESSPIKYEMRKNVRCKPDNEAACPRALFGGCNSFTWVVRRITLNTPKQKFVKYVQDLVMKDGHPFRIHTIMESDYPDYWLVVSFYLPNILFHDKCNQLYCIYIDPSRDIYEYKPAKAGDASFAYCPIPEFSITDQTRLQLAYRPEVMSSSFPLVVESPVTDLPYVNLTICVMVRKEAENMVEWIEFHQMMGYSRFIIYDNNPFGEPDEFMEELLQIYPSDVLIRRHWKLPHSQTEAYTDCINRFGKTTLWMTLIDVDEFIVPHPDYPTVISVLDDRTSRHSNIHVTWLTFGPCGEEERKRGQLMMELCHHTTRPSSDYPKSIFKAGIAAGMQNYGPHYVRLKRDVGKNIMSKNSVTKYLRNYHYRYRTHPEFVQRRKGPRAGRALKWTSYELEQEWKDGIKYSEKLSNEDNWILRFHDKLNERTKKVFSRIIGGH